MMLELRNILMSIDLRCRPDDMIRSMKKIMNAGGIITDTYNSDEWVHLKVSLHPIDKDEFLKRVLS